MGNVIIRVPVQELRDIFNALDIARKGRRGVLERRVNWTGSHRPRHLPVGSISRTWLYFVPNTDYLVATAHIYLGRGGRLLGEPDPKLLHLGQVFFTPAADEF